MDELDRYWLAGLLEGEGCFGSYKSKKAPRHAASIQLVMADRDVVHRARKVSGGRGDIGIRHDNRSDNYSDTYSWRITGTWALSLMREIRPLMGERRGAKIDEILERHAEELDRHDLVVSLCGANN